MIRISTSTDSRKCFYMMSFATMFLFNNMNFNLYANRMDGDQTGPR